MKFVVCCGFSCPSTPVFHRFPQYGNLCIAVQLPGLPDGGPLRAERIPYRGAVLAIPFGDVELGAGWAAGVQVRHWADVVGSGWRRDRGAGVHHGRVVADGPRVIALYRSVLCIAFHGLGGDRPDCAITPSGSVEYVFMLLLLRFRRRGVG